MKTHANKVVAIALATFALGASSSARADQQSENAAQAEALFREARDLLVQHRASDACPKLAASQRLDPGYGTLYNLADCQLQIGQTASAWASYREAADMARKAGQEDREKKAAQHASEIEPLLERMTLRVRTTLPGMIVKRDEVTVDAGTFGSALPVDPGRHVISATAPGKQPFSVTVTTKGPGKNLDVYVPNLDDAASTTPETSNETPTKDGSTQRIAGVVVGGAGVIGVVVGAIFGASASSKWSDAKNNHCRTATLCDATGVGLTSDAKSAATISTIAFVVGGAAIAGGVVLIVTAPKKKASETSLAISPTLGGLVAHGAF